MTAADYMQTFLEQASTELKLNDGQKFRLETAVRSLKLLQGDSSIEKHRISSLNDYANYVYPGLPNIRQLFVLAYNLLSGPNVWQQQKEFVVAYLANADKWKAVQAIFDINVTLSEELQKTNNVVNTYTIFSGKLDELLLQEKNSSNKRKALFKLVTKIKNEFTKAKLDKLNPLIEALFMIMRGHNKGLENNKEQNKPACAEGAYLNIMKVLGEIEQTKGIMSDISKIKIELCDGSTTSVG